MYTMAMGPQFDFCMRATNNPSYFAVANDAATVGQDEVDCKTTPVRCWPDGSRSLQRRPRLPDSPRRRDFRALLRSLSAREGFQDGFLQGNPRPGDVAPSELDKVTMRIKSGKITSNVLTPEGPKEREEVFYTLPLQNRRRHSVGGYLTAGSPTSPTPVGPSCPTATSPAARITAVPSEVPRMPAPKVAQSDSIKRKKPKDFNFKEMEDIAIVWCRESPESELWSDYLVTCFDKIMSHRARNHYRVTTTPVEEIIGQSTPEQLQKISKSQLQIVILCPRLAEKMTCLKRETASAGVDMLRSEKVLVMLLGVEREDIVMQNKAEYPAIEAWQMMQVVEKDAAFVDNFLTAAVGKLRTKDCKDTATEKTGFSIVPKKVKMGQSRVIALLNEPSREEDSIKIMVDKKGEVIQISSFKRRNPYTLQFDIPDSCLEVSMLIWIRITKNGQSLGRRQIKCESRLRELDQILRSTDHPLEFMCQTLGFKTTNREQLDNWMLSSFKKNVPPNFNMLSCSGQYNPTRNLQSSEEYPTLLHFAARYGLEKLCWQLLECPGGEAACNIRNVRQLTPAELANAAGFSHLAVVLKGHMQMNEFSNVYYYLKNMTIKEETDVKDAAPTETNNELKIVEAGDVDDEHKHSSDEYNPEETSTDPFSEECLQNLEISGTNQPRPRIFNLPLINIPNKVQLYQNDIVFPPPEGIDRVQQAIEHDYIVQPSNIKVETSSPKFRPKNLYINSNVMAQQSSEIFLYSPTEEVKSFSIDTPTSEIAQLLGKESCKSTAPSVVSGRDNSPLNGQDELVEIINDFKNNVFSISEVEKLVMEWRNRNETQQSLKEKQDQLNKMREEYDRLQQQIKDNMKRPTPFERVKKLFSKGKSKINEDKNGSIEKRNGNQRPNSSLSESSASSGRLSTASGASVGESSLQSELDDKRARNTSLGLALPFAREDISSNALSLSASVVDIDTKHDYLVPPPPRPLAGYPVMTTFGHHKMATIEEKEVAQENTHVRMSFDGICRSNSLPEGKTSRHMYMNIASSKS